MMGFLDGELSQLAGHRRGHRYTTSRQLPCRAPLRILSVVRGDSGRMTPLTRLPRSAATAEGRGPRRALVWLAPLSALLAGTAAAAGLLDGVREGGDLSAYDPVVGTALIAERSTALTAVTQVFTFMGSALALVPLTAFVLLTLALRGRWRSAVAVAGGMSASLLLTVVLKATVGRLRPAAVDVLGTVNTGYAFPSGHTLNATMFYGLLAGLLILQTRSTRARIGIVTGWVVLAFGVGVSRVYLGYHWMTDVMAGWSLGVAVLGSVLLVSMLTWRGRDSRR